MKSTRGVNVIVKGSKDDKYGYLKISIRRGGKTIVYSLGIKVLKKDFNINTQLMRASAPDAEEINEYIENKVNSFSYKPYHTGRIKSICVFMQKIIDDTNVKSTKQKYENLLRLFQEYLRVKYGKDDLYFEDIDSFIISGFHNHLITKAVKNSENTANYKLKSFKSFFSKIKQQGLYYWTVDPFITLKFKWSETKKDSLTFEEFKKLVNKDFVETRERTSEIKFFLQDIKEAFIFSTLAQGVRISDVMTCRWNDFDFDTKDFNSINALVIRKRMIKTKKFVFIFLDNFSSQFLINCIFKVISDCPERKRLEDCIVDKRKIQKRISDFQFSQFVGEDPPFELGEPGKNDNSKDCVDSSLNAYLGNSSIEKLKYDLEQINHDIFVMVYNFVGLLSKAENSRTKFVFPFLDNELFENIGEDNDFSILTEKQFLQFQGRRSYVNKLTKELVLKQISPSKRLSFHSARHTYTSLILQRDEVGINIYDLMKSLGHTSILSTEKYIQGFNHKKISRLNSSLSKAIFD